jgi:hypothetical protein
MNDIKSSTLDGRPVVRCSNDGFPWVASAMLALEASEVIRLRLEKLARCEADAPDEVHLMVNEKIAAAFEAGFSWLSGATPGAIICRYREHVAANARRLAV